MNTLDLTADIIDVRDIIERIEELEAKQPLTNEELAELDHLRAIMYDLKDNGGDEQWRGDWYPVTLIRDAHFEDYAREFAEDIGAVNKSAEWPNNHIDWATAAEALQQDYTTTDINGTDYWYR